jgi:hypothetical protein
VPCCLSNYKVLNVNVLAKQRVQLARMYIYLNRKRIVMEIAAIVLIRGIEDGVLQPQSSPSFGHC